MQDLRTCRTYTLVDGVPRPEPDVLVWERWRRTADRTLARTTLGGSVVVTTLFLGEDAAGSFEDGPGVPVLWETRIHGGVLGGTVHQYTSAREALNDHAELVEIVQAIQ